MLLFLSSLLPSNKGVLIICLPLELVFNLIFGAWNASSLVCCMNGFWVLWWLLDLIYWFCSKLNIYLWSGTLGGHVEVGVVACAISSGLFAAFPSIWSKSFKTLLPADNLFDGTGFCLLGWRLETICLGVAVLVVDQRDSPQPQEDWVFLAIGDVWP